VTTRLISARIQAERNEQSAAIFRRVNVRTTKMVRSVRIEEAIGHVLVQVDTVSLDADRVKNIRAYLSLDFNAYVFNLASRIGERSRRSHCVKGWRDNYKTDKSSVSSKTSERIHSVQSASDH
jgi:hypothetical protein